jgi:hypothetical protein
VVADESPTTERPQLTMDEIATARAAARAARQARRDIRIQCSDPTLAEPDLLPAPPDRVQHGAMHRAFAVASGIRCLVLAGSARAQNTDPFFLGDEPALASGAVVASGRDTGSLWYNPAEFGGLSRGLVSASASTFGVRIRRIRRIPW